MTVTWFVKRAVKQECTPTHDLLAAFRLGAAQIVPVNQLVEVANMIGQSGIKAGAAKIPPVRYAAIVEALEQVAGRAQADGKSIHMPRIGDGLAGGDWSRIETILVSLVERHGVSIYVYTL